MKNKQQNQIDDFCEDCDKQTLVEKYLQLSESVHRENNKKGNKVIADPEIKVPEDGNWWTSKINNSKE